jgi:hypothetical protein
MALRPEVTSDRTTALLFAGDVLCIALFATVGALQHPAPEPLFRRVPEIAAPFLLGWLAVGGFAGVFDREVYVEPRPLAVAVGIGWLGADLVGQLLRATTSLRGSAAPTFFLVTLFVGGALLLGWRLLAARALS